MGVFSILVIDDEDAVRILLPTALEQAGYVVREAVNGVEGFNSFANLSQPFRRTNPGIKILVLRKPFEMAVFLQTVERLLAGDVSADPSKV